jgi:hypothetical protein
MKKTILSLFLGLAASALQGQYSINWFKIAGGGGTSTNGQYSLSGTIGQHDAGGPMTNGPYSLVGGFWALPVLVQTPGTPTIYITNARARFRHDLVDAADARLHAAIHRQPLGDQLGQRPQRHEQSRHRAGHAAGAVLPPAPTLNPTPRSNQTMKHSARNLALGLGLLSTLSPQLSTCFAQGTAFTYQGRLDDGANPASGIYDLRFAIHDSSGGPTVIAGPLTNPPTAISNGLFTATLDFGPGVFTGADRWLEIAVRTNGGGAFTALLPRQRLTPSPYAIYAPNASVAVTATTATSVGANAVATIGLQNSSVTSAKIADGTIAAADVNSASFATTFWKANGNASTTPGTHFLGTTDNQVLELKVNGQRALRLAPTANNAPNVIGGSSFNEVPPGVIGAAIGGGGGVAASSVPYTNRVAGDFSVVAGGLDNRVDVQSAAATISGGQGNTIQTNAFAGVISGGFGNRIGNASTYDTIAGGQINKILDFTDNATIGGGEAGEIGSHSDYATIAGGFLNTVGGDARWSTIGGGGQNTIAADSESTTIAGGRGHVVQSLAHYAAIAGGGGHTVHSNAYAGFIGGGEENSLGMNASWSAIGGGYQNATSGDYATVGGGAHNNAGSHYATIPGGCANDIAADALAASIAGGLENRIGLNADYGTVGGGRSNYVFGSSVGATIGGGGENISAGIYCTIPGGWRNFTFGSYSLAAGRNAQANHPRSFVWSSRDNPAPSFAANRLHVHAQEGLSVDYAGQRPDGGGERWIVLGGLSDFPGQTISTWTGARLTDGGVWADNSDRNTKENFSPVNPREILERVATLPVQDWNYKVEGPEVRHIGPVAQDFHAAFGTGHDDKHLAALDTAGVALAAIQGLNQKLEAQNRDLKARLARLEGLVQKLAAPGSEGVR